MALGWKRSLRRSFFVLQYTTNPGAAGGWQHCRSLSTTRTVVTGLEPGRPYWFRLMAQNAAGQSSYTQPLCVRAA